MKTLLLVAGFLLLFGVEILRVYFIMPFPGSQQNDTINLAYWLHNISASSFRGFAVSGR